jgi:two-component system response regulator HydG
LVASAIHYHSQRAEGPYLQINCATLTPELTASELFGHRRGAFTGAGAARRGYFEQANGGTLLLDEVGELSPEVQGKLLRVLQDGEIQRLGEARPRRVDVRVLAATNRTLQTELREKRFRDDLYYRLAVATIHIPSLQERTEDIPLLAEHFLRRFEKELDRPDLSLSRETLAVLIQRPWPGNAREIQNVLRLAVIRAPGNVIHPEHLDPSPSSKRGARCGEGPRTLAEIEHQAMDDALHEADGNVTAAAKRLGVDRSTLWRKMKRRRDIVTNAKTGS